VSGALLQVALLKLTD